jgi:cell wall-associated NlpC family hydrolase
VRESEADATARLLERLLTDPMFRRAFRRDPVGASRQAGLDSVADEMALTAGKAMDTLDVRESRSSLAGVLMAAAFEGVGAYDFSENFVSHLSGVPDHVEQVLSRVNLPAVPSGLAVADAQAAEPPGAAPDRIAAAEPVAAAQVAGEFKAITPDQVDQAHAASEPVDPGQLGAEGSGGAPSAETLALLQNKNVTLDSTGIADFKAGKMDPRIASVLTAIARDHRITVSAAISDHDRLTTGGSVSNHFYGRAVDIATVDGQPVGPGNDAARQIATALEQLDPSIRPSEIGSPWALPGAAYFTDGAHQNHLHIAFDDPIAPSWQAPQDGAAGVPDAAAVPDDSSAPDDSDGDDGGDSDESSEPGGLEDPGGDTDAEADQESDGDGGDEDDDSVSDDASDEQENDENSSDSSDGDDSDGDSSDSGDGGDGLPDGSGVDLGDVDGSYPGDDASQAQIAAWMGAQAEKRGIPPELPVMAGLVESGLRNLDGGDADSVGFFQMRVGIWNTGDYAGYPDQAELQLKWFLDQAAAVKEQRIAAGKPVDDPGSYGDWIADVERPAAQYRGRYQLRLEEARGLLKAGASSGSNASGDGVAEQVDAVAGGGSSSAGRRALAAVAAAKSELGTPYLWGGSSPETGFDCSGLVQWAYAKVGIQIPRTSEQQILASNGHAVDRHHLIAGDLVFFRDSGGDVHHVGISLGGDKFINAPHTGDVVKVASLDEPYYAQQFAGGRRFDMSGGQKAEWVAASAGAAEGSAPGIDPASVEEAEAALARDAAEVNRPGTLLFRALQVQELHKEDLGLS